MAVDQRYPAEDPVTTVEGLIQALHKAAPQLRAELDGYAAGHGPLEEMSITAFEDVVAPYMAKELQADNPEPVVPLLHLLERLAASSQEWIREHALNTVDEVVLLATQGRYGGILDRLETLAGPRVRSLLITQRRARTGI